MSRALDNRENYPTTIESTCVFIQAALIYLKGEFTFFGLVIFFSSPKKGTNILKLLRILSPLAGVSNAASCLIASRTRWDNWDETKLFVLFLTINACIGAEGGGSKKIKVHNNTYVIWMQRFCKTTTKFKISLNILFQISHLCWKELLVCQPFSTINDQCTQMSEKGDVLPTFLMDRMQSVRFSKGSRKKVIFLKGL